MAFYNEARRVLIEDSPFFKAEVLKEYRFQLNGARLLNTSDNLYTVDNPKWEFTLLDIDAGKVKKWTTGGQAIRDMIDQEIDEGDIFSVIKTGDVGKGKKYWRIKKLNAKDMPAPDVSPSQEPLPDEPKQASWGQQLPNSPMHDYEPPAPTIDDIPM